MVRIPTQERGNQKPETVVKDFFTTAADGNDYLPAVETIEFDALHLIPTLLRGNAYISEEEE